MASVATLVQTKKINCFKTKKYLNTQLSSFYAIILSVIRISYYTVILFVIRLQFVHQNIVSSFTIEIYRDHRHLSTLNGFLGIRTNDHLGSWYFATTKTTICKWGQDFYSRFLSSSRFFMESDKKFVWLIIDLCHFLQLALPTM